MNQHPLKGNINLDFKNSQITGISTRTFPPWIEPKIYQTLHEMIRKETNVKAKQECMYSTFTE